MSAAGQWVVGADVVAWSQLAAILFMLVANSILHTWTRLATEISHGSYTNSLPKWTGTFGAFATSFPSGENKAHEKSRRSLILVDSEVFWKIRLIWSATDMNR